MWRSLAVLTRLPSLLAEIAALLREQCLLLRELIQRTSGGVPAKTPQTPGSLPPPERPTPPRKLQAQDVRVITRAERRKAQEAAEDRRNRPWATGELGPPAREPEPPTP